MVLESTESQKKYTVKCSLSPDGGDDDDDNDNNDDDNDDNNSSAIALSDDLLVIFKNFRALLRILPCAASLSLQEAVNSRSTLSVSPFNSTEHAFLA